MEGIRNATTNEQTAPPLNRCDVCHSAIDAPQTRCDYCTANELTPEDFENWAAACDDARSDI